MGIPIIDGLDMIEHKIYEFIREQGSLHSHSCYNLNHEGTGRKVSNTAVSYSGRNLF